MPSQFDIARKYLVPKFRDVEFQVTTWRFSFEHDHAIHKIPDRDSAFIEATGRGPATYVFESPFRLGIADWDVEAYPAQWRLFATACLDRTTGTLQHPELGKVKVKCRSFDTSFDPMRRDGVDVSVTFVESSLDEDELSKLFKQASPIGIATNFAVKLDGQIADANPKPEVPEALSPSLLESLSALNGLASQFKLGFGNVLSAIDSYLGALAELGANIEALDDIAAQAMMASLNALYKAVVDLSLTVTTKERPVTVAKAAATTTPDQVAALFGMKLDELFQLNPMLAEKSTVKKDTQIFVYAA